jgi:hypothetical protein
MYPLLLTVRFRSCGVTGPRHVFGRVPEQACDDGTSPVMVSEAVDGPILFEGLTFRLRGHKDINCH